MRNHPNSQFSHNTMSFGLSSCLVGLLAILVSPSCLAHTTVIKLGYQETIWGSPAMVAVARHVWKHTGIKVDPVVLSSGKAVRDATISGSVDIGTLGATPYIVGAAKANLVTVGTVAYAGKTLSLIGKKGSISNVKQLKGKAIGSKLGSSTNHILVAKVLPALGLHKGQYKIDNVTFSNQVAALSNGSIAAFAGVEPYNSLAVRDGIGVKLANFGKYDMSPLFLGMKRSFYSQHTHAVAEFMKGWKRAVNYYNRHLNEAAGLVNNKFKHKGLDLPTKVIANSMEEMDVTTKYRSDLKPYITDQLKALNLMSKERKVMNSLITEYQ